MRIFLLSTRATWAHRLTEQASALGWTLSQASSADEFRQRFVDAEVDILVAESLQQADLVDTLSALRASGATCGVVWVQDATGPRAEGTNYAHFADRRVDTDAPWCELEALLLSLLAMLRRYDWR